MQSGKLPARLRRSPAELLQAAGPLLGLLFIILVFFLYDVVPDGSVEKFVTVFNVSNLKIVATQATVIAVAALGMTIIIVSGGIDLSPGSAIALGTVAIALGMRGFVPPGAEEPIVLGVTGSLALGVVTCVLVGFVNGAVITGFRIVPFIVTLGMMSVARGTAKLLADERKIPCDETWVSRLLWVDRSPTASA
ncbi:MAG TPA: hypothetical protein VK116_16810, partial [Planctomycetota bacterium]|nr:hypothetical protein [Planctomycetota bacterium]